MKPISSHLDQTNLVNKGFIIWLSGKFFMLDTTGSPEMAPSCPLTQPITLHDLVHLARSRSWPYNKYILTSVPNPCYFDADFYFRKTVVQKCILCGSRKYPYHHHGGNWKFRRGGGLYGRFMYQSNRSFNIPPRATPGHLYFLQNFCSNSHLPRPKSCSNAPSQVHSR